MFKSPAFGGVYGAGGESGAIYEAISDGITAIGLGGSQGSTKPAAFINYLVFDKNLNYLSGGFLKTVPTSSGVMQKYIVPDISITEPGYIYVYLSNESSNTIKLILFDEMNVSLTRPILQVNEYYPFGMEMAEKGYENVLEPENKFTYNGKELQDELDLDWYDYGARMYDASVGRWWVVDPISEEAYDLTPYRYAQNNPIKISDPDGLDDFYVIAGSMLLIRRVWMHC
ncbi:MAG: RHS repeat-associated core domain-containing protein [Cyclobacteriaceae bacterium]|nr:RHS repeat-associated core domain-containing protein [Cyclobacteriaceae bacterium]